VSIVLAVVVPLAVGAGAGVAFLRGPEREVTAKVAQPTAAAQPAQRPGSEPSAGPEPTAEQEVAEVAAASAAPPPEAKPESKEPPTPAPDPAAELVARAARGQPEAMERIEETPREARSVAETLALARGRVASRSRELEALRQDFSRTPPEMDGDDVDPRLVQLKAFIDDRDTAVAALEVAAGLPGTAGPDMLYETWVGTRGRNETTWLAEQLVYTQAVRSRASEALKVALDLRAADEDCEAVLEILPRAAEHGDRRSARLLKRLLSKRGCGKRKRKDCYSCLRHLDRKRGAMNVRKARALVRTRRGHKIP
jgi:hypothetical protein